MCKTIVIKVLHQYDADKQIPLSSSVVNNINYKTHLNLIYREHMECCECGVCL